MDEHVQQENPAVPVQPEEKQQKSSLGKYLLIFAAGVIIALAGVGVYALAQHKTKTPTLTSKKISAATPTISTPISPTPTLTETLGTYTNKAEGFSIQYPTKVLDMSCVNNQYINPGIGTLIALDDPANNAVHFTVADEGFPMNSPATAPQGYTYYQVTGCTNIHITLANINNYVYLGMGKDQGEKPRNDVYYYQTITSENDLVPFFESKFGVKDCAIGTRQDLGENNGIDITLSQGPACYRYKIRYSPTKHLAITWRDSADQPIWQYNMKSYNPVITFQ